MRSFRRRPRCGDRRALPLDRFGRIQRPAPGALWVLEEHDGRVWVAQGVSDHTTDAARFMLRR